MPKPSKLKTMPTNRRFHKPIWLFVTVL